VVLKQPDLETSDSPLAALIEAFPARVGIDLRLPEDVERERRKGKSRRQRQSMLLALASAALLFYVASDESDKLAARDVYQRKIQGTITTLKKSQDLAETDAQKATKNSNTLALAFQPAQRLGDAIALVTNRVPDGVWLSGVTVERGKLLIVRGTAKTSDAVAAYMQNLTQEPRLRDVKLVYSNNGQIQQTPVQQFSLSAFPVGNLALFDPTAKKTKTGGTSQ
jgi:Tfp pilus assembly protein PilN